MPPQRPATPPKRRSPRSTVASVLELHSPIAGLSADADQKLQFLCHYGYRIKSSGKSSESNPWFTGLATKVKSRTQLTKKHYKSIKCLWDFEFQGVRAQVFQAGPFHVYVHVETPLPSLHYANVFKVMLEAVKMPYALFKHNCVTATAKILNAINPSLFPNPEAHWSPAAFIEKIKQYAKIDAYMKQHQTNSWVQQSAWLFSSRSVTSGHQATAMKTVLHIYGLHRGCSGKRSRDNLVEKGWLVVQDNGLLLPGDNAPEEFANALKMYTLYLRDRVLPGSGLASVSGLLAQGVKSRHYADMTSDNSAIVDFFNKQLDADFDRLGAEFEKFTQAKTAASETRTRLAA